ncbi:redoxin domain-containing protein [Salipaludibacillus daqingensis]|uniref:redoxin domain-containing protein n=1 Tax=Salipaludibacillus daqingensis TaxID=3041001 RepID=UPI002476A6BB|nr:redoxin domain-containing protein [Salipaludibacillus daqingensis]
MEAFIFYSVVFLWIIQIVILFAMFLLFRQFGEVYLTKGEAVAKDGLAIGKETPSIKVFSLTQNKVVELKELFHRPTLLTFLSPNCKPCESVIEDWNRAYKSYSDKVNFCVVILGRDEEVKALLKKDFITGEKLWDRKEELFHHFLVRVTPFAFALDQNGVVKDKGLCGNKEQIDLLVSSVMELPIINDKEENK